MLVGGLLIWCSKMEYVFCPSDEPSHFVFLWLFSKKMDHGGQCKQTPICAHYHRKAWDLGWNFCVFTLRCSSNIDNQIILSWIIMRKLDCTIRLFFLFVLECIQLRKYGDTLLCVNFSDFSCYHFIKGSRKYIVVFISIVVLLFLIP